jgi:Beta-lactamase
MLKLATIAQAVLLLNAVWISHPVGPAVVARRVPQTAGAAGLPDTPAGGQLGEFLRAYNTGNPDVIRRFVSGNLSRSALEQRPADARAATLAATFNITRQLRLHSTERASDYEVVALCQSVVTESWFSVSIQVEPRPPYGISGLTFGFAARPADVILRRNLNGTQIIRGLDTYLTKLNAAGLINGTVGQNYFDYVREHVFAPAGMTNTELTAALGNSAGGGRSTVGDLLKFDSALRRHRLLSARLTNTILSPKVNTGEGEAYGYGFETFLLDGKRIVGHSGGGDADNRLDMYLDDGYTAAALTRPHAAEYVSRKLKELITGR